MSRIVKLNTLGGAEVLELEETALAEPGPGEVRLTCKAIGLNRAEVLFRQGRYLEAPQLPCRIGYEASGYVDKLGEGVEDFAPGDFVSTIPSFSQSRFGVYGEFAIVPARALAKMPSKLTPAQAASVWMQYLTAYGALIELGNLESNQFVVITAASSSVGLAAIEMVKDRGGFSIATTRTKMKKQALLDFGADFVIATEEEDLPKRVMEITEGKGADLLFDSVSGPLLVELAKAARYESTIFIYGALSLETTAFPLRLALKKGLSIRGYTMFQITDDQARLERGKRYVLEGLERGTFKPVVDKVFSGIEQIGDAHRYMESNQQMGKIVVELA